jgi:hypothetical protein
VIEWFSDLVIVLIALLLANYLSVKLRPLERLFYLRKLPKWISLFASQKKERKF